MDEPVKKKRGRPTNAEVKARKTGRENLIHRQTLDEGRKSNAVPELVRKKKYKVSTVELGNDGWFEGRPLEIGLYWVRGLATMCPKIKNEGGVPVWSEEGVKHDFKNLYLIGMIRCYGVQKKGPNPSRWFGYPWGIVEDKFYEYCQFRRVENELNGNVPLVFTPKVEDPTIESEEKVEDVRSEF
jgi:hypothetical protein